MSAPSAPTQSLHAVPRAWRVRQRDADATRVLAEASGLSEPIAHLLLARGITTADAARTFLQPRLTDLLSPSGLRGMDPAVQLILAVMQREEPIVVYGDYDVDGMTASSTLFRFLSAVGAKVSVFLPDRFRDGYGLNPDRVNDLVTAGARLIITVDCGITAVGAVKVARDLGADVIIVDHHRLPSGPLPDASVIINPHHPECTFGFKELCAAGLAFHLAMALRAELRARGAFLETPEPDVRDLLPFAAIGTIADLVPLRGINRILTAHGLVRFAADRRAGLRALRAVALGQKSVTASAVAFQVAPRLNAAGRLSSPMKCFELLTTDDGEAAFAIAQGLDAENTERRGIQETIEKSALAQALEQQGESAAAYVLWDPGWHAGVAGIVAARVVERFHRPCAVIALVDGVGKGSLRSISGFDVLAGLERCAEHLIQFGGHAHAAGVTIAPENLPAFREAFVRAAEALTPKESLTPTLTLDDELSFGRVTTELLEHLHLLAPFGAGNPEPAFLTRGVRVVRRRPVGQTGEHFRLELGHDGLTLPAVAFRAGERCPNVGELIDIAYKPEFNDWQGQLTLQLRLVDVRPATN